MTLYDILGVPVTASQDDIRREYRQRALRIHPDRQRGVGSSRVDAASFAELQHAYEVLSDDIRRAAYDSDLAHAGGGHSSSVPGVQSHQHDAWCAGGFSQSHVAQGMVRQAAHMSSTSDAWDSRFEIGKSGVTRRTAKRTQRNRTAPGSVGPMGRQARFAAGVFGATNFWQPEVAAASRPTTIPNAPSSSHRRAEEGPSTASAAQPSDVHVEEARGQPRPATGSTNDAPLSRDKDDSRDLPRPVGHGSWKRHGASIGGPTGGGGGGGGGGLPTAPPRQLVMRRQLVASSSSSQQQQQQQQQRPQTTNSGAAGLPPCRARASSAVGGPRPRMAGGPPPPPPARPMTGQSPSLVARGGSSAAARSSASADKTLAVFFGALGNSGAHQRAASATGRFPRM